MSTLKMSLPPEASRDIARLIASGRYRSVDEVLTAATRNLVTLEEEKAAVKLVPLRLTAQIEWSDGQCCAYCPELDLATAMDTEEEALTDLAEMAVEYAEDYLEDLAFYAKSPNRAEHLPFILAVAECTTDVYDVEGVRKVQELFESTHGATT
jgi:Arc/MetJ-type ribon-helix-helix transcriptional regulator